MIVTLHPEVDSDLLDAMNYYEREAVPELALEFYVEFRRCANVIATRGTAFQVSENGVRRMNLKRFSFHILFEVLSEKEVEIFAVKHDRQHPDLGMDRF